MFQWLRRSKPVPPKDEDGLTPEDVMLIQTSFGAVAPIADQAADLFYVRLFEIAPNVRALFKDDLSEQGRKLMGTLSVVVQGLNDLDAIVPVAEDLARRHVGYGVTASDYAPVGEALLWTLEKGLGDAFTPDVERAWSKAYGTLSNVMIAAAEAAPSEAQAAQGGAA